MENVVKTFMVADRPAPAWPPGGEAPSYQLRFERYNHVSDPEPSHSFAYPHLVRPFKDENSHTRRFTVASWEQRSETQHITQHIPFRLMSLPVGANETLHPVGGYGRWFVVLTSDDILPDGRGHNWVLCDASHFFTMDGDLTKIPYKKFGTLALFNDAVNSSVWDNADTNMGYFMQILPYNLSTDGIDLWEPTSDFGDFRRGWSFFRGANRTALDSMGKWLAMADGSFSPVNQTGEFQHSENNSNWRVIATQHMEAPTVNGENTPPVNPDIATLEAKINKAKEHIRETTMEHDGCDGGKRDFLEGTGLFTDEEIDSFFERDFDVDFEVTVRYSLTVKARDEDDAREVAEEGGYRMHDPVIIEAVREMSHDYQFLGVEES